MMISRDSRRKGMTFAPKLEALESRMLLSFLPATNYAIGTNSVRLATGVFRTETELIDLAVSSYQAGAVSILSGKGNGAFQQPKAYQVGDGPVGVATGDLNCDGNQDVATANYIGDSVSVRFGTGGRRFFPQAYSYVTGVDPYEIRIGDFTQDGIPDIATTLAINSDYSVAILKGHCNTEFDQPTFIDAGGFNSPDLVVGDFSHDGIPDLAVTHYPNEVIGQVSILLGKADGTFEPPVTYDTKPSPFQIDAGDMNGDGNLDLVIAYAKFGEVGIMLGNGDGTFKLPLYILVGDSDSYMTSVVVGDFGDGNGIPDGPPDGINDFAVTLDFDNEIAVCYGPHPFFSCQYHQVGLNPIDIVAADVNGDTLSDLGTANANGDLSDVSILLNTATPIPAPKSPPTFFAIASIQTLKSMDRMNFSTSPVVSKVLQWASAPTMPIEKMEAEHDVADTNHAVVRPRGDGTRPADFFSAIKPEHDGLADPLAIPR